MAAIDAFFDTDDDQCLNKIKEQRFLYPKLFEKDAMKQLKKNPNDTPAVIWDLGRDVQRELRPYCGETRLFKGRTGSQALHKRILPRFYAYVQMDAAGKIVYVTRVLQELAKKPTVVTRNLGADQYRAYIWLHPDEFESIRNEYSSYYILYKAKTDTDTVKQKIQDLVRCKDEVLFVVCSLIEPEGDHVDLCDYFQNRVVKASPVILKALGLPATDPTFRLFKEYFTEDRAAANITNKNGTVRGLSVLVMEHGTDKITTILKEYFKDLDENNDNDDD